MRKAFVVLIAAASFVFPAAAVAKGPDYAVLTGPGISGSIRIDGDGEAGPGAPLGAFVAYGGYATQMFGHHPNDPTTRVRPAGDLGARYRVTYSVPTPNGRWTIKGDVYPYAEPRPVTYMKPGQPFYTMHTNGGWYVTRPGFRRTLGELGVPGIASPRADGHTWRWIGIGAGSFAALVAVAAAVAVRRRPQSAPAPAA